MARSPLRNLRVDDATWARWQSVAGDLDENMAVFLKTGVEHRIAALGKPGPPQPANGNGAAAARTAMCVHRRPPGSFCSRCDV